MDLFRYSERIMQLDQLIRRRGTGSPKECASRLGVSERSLYDIINQLRDIFGSPIEYCKERKSYYYTQPGRIALKFIPDSPDGE